MQFKNIFLRLLYFLLFITIIFVQCKKSPDPAPPVTPPTTNPPTTNPPVINPPVTNPPVNPPTTGSGVTLMRGTGGTTLYYDYTSHGELVRYLSQDGFASTVKLNFDSAALVRTKLVNPQTGTMTATPIISNFGYTRWEITFSNTNSYSNNAQVSNPDTAGKLQIWIYREDGQDIIPASGSRPAVKRIIQVPGKFPTDPAGIGLIRLLDFDFAGYPVHPASVTNTSLQKIGRAHV